MEYIAGKELADYVGLKPRQIANLARAGKIPGAFRPHGYQFLYEATPDLSDWAEMKRLAVRRKKNPPSNKNKLNEKIITIHRIRLEFEIWQRRVDLESLADEDVEEVRSELRAFVRIDHRLAELQDARRSAPRDNVTGQARKSRQERSPCEVRPCRPTSQQGGESAECCSHTAKESPMPLQKIK
jgi:hypothetical protein